ncbi:phospholipase D-like domain-containing protein [Methylobrevis pamukkalensis]|uniref:Phospholipase D n=1 Tax=Methylobrevis pamukkalensis TaxID=1439726 RepID=A0A1E3H083_9HYPH|nr:phospholipase D-like domain-containing protein [Methylobrevis pamukkalensis]ODN69694.1 cardiolipin synthetase [Methylobrevis pamukkalensis]
MPVPAMPAAEPNDGLNDAGADTAGGEALLFRPGQNCWQRPQASRAAALVDAAAYFNVLDTCLRRARHRILIAGWDFDARIELRPSAGDRAAPSLGRLLRGLVEANPDLHVDVLVWSLSVFHTGSARLPMLFGCDWEDHPRIRVVLDRHHPIYAAHHQKIVVIDDAVAFTGGIDLTIDRWDTRRHTLHDPRRCGPDGDGCSPIHDVQFVVEGDAARALGEVVRQRWRTARGIEIPQVSPAAGIWPADLAPDFEAIPVAVARTLPGWGRSHETMEAARQTLDILAAAKRSIYIETQYMSSSLVGEVLAAHLANPDGPEIVVVMAHEARGLIERLVMGVNRNRLIRRLARADRFGRLRICYPVVAAPDREEPIVVHSKVIIVDDRLMKVGSSNLNNRSLGLDTECDLGIEAVGPRERAAVLHLRNTLLAEHLGLPVARLAERLAAGTSMAAAIDAQDTGRRALRIFPEQGGKGPDRPMFGTSLLDPVRPFRLFRRKAPAPLVPPLGIRQTPG